jgi:hypothetical protein
MLARITATRRHSVQVGGLEANLVPARVHLGEASLPDLLVDDELADGIDVVPSMPARAGGRGSASHGFL